jgi:hypothetical protein
MWQGHYVAGCVEEHLIGRLEGVLQVRLVRVNSQYMGSIRSCRKDVQLGGILT